MVAMEILTAFPCIYQQALKKISLFFVVFAKFLVLALIVFHFSIFLLQYIKNYTHQQPNRKSTSNILMEI